MDELLYLIALAVGVAAIVIAIRFRVSRRHMLRKIEDKANDNQDE